MIVRLPEPSGSVNKARSGPTGSRTDFLYSGCSQHEDILPTLFDLLDIAVPEWVQGFSFAHIWENSPTKSKPQFTLLRYPEETCGYILTNVKDDPLEYNNLIGNPDYAEIEKELKNELHDWLLRTPHYFPEKEYLW